MVLETARVNANQTAGGAYRLLVIEAPHIAPQVQPGQFLHLRIPNLDGSVLRRPFSIFKADGSTVSVFYKSVGRGTAAMASLRTGDEISLMGPLGHGFPVQNATGFPLLVAGGYGIAALYLVARSLPTRGILFAGGAAAGEIICLDDFHALKWEVRVATDDGSMGDRGLVTVPVDRWLREERKDRTPEFWACGPMGMLKAVGDRAIAGGWNAWLSLDRHMGCGVGACLACVQKIRTPESGVGWARVCKDGPVFESRSVVWEAAGA